MNKKAETAPKKAPSDKKVIEAESISDALSEAAKHFHAQEHDLNDARLAEEEVRAEAQAERQEAEELLKEKAETEKEE